MNTVPFNVTTDKLTDYVSFSEAAEQMGVRFQQVYQRAEKGKLGVVKTLFNKKLILKSELAKWKVSREEYFKKLK